ncbi:hypothetical protein SAMN02746065_12510 [Desulfocicer vacuolatum DSM 3385]|uniref:Uncharacterized protein n=1 Tax=Desulfocicer vacuolatum DSM 3385 TaxID=1121400 RepID=A0A1W2E5T5_9BACT|nr:hypothetical protein SAMN02746065_12510 [Desulfocicer vacuolatum DSM 3385]
MSEDSVLPEYLHIFVTGENEKVAAFSHKKNNNLECQNGRQKSSH